eukprot:467108-Pelagomonas_calceolata.AAC.4
MQTPSHALRLLRKPKASPEKQRVIAGRGNLCQQGKMPARQGWGQTLVASELECNEAGGIEG